ncbi:MAG TPA: WD40 repeat domain-containing serine/threonine-protein kinase [Candidatus Hydrogenedentes bacterium]|nr:WD40 repeat domain-containing serine/threonine-protein kinase [Candidatus Hydrogenedentota bacterium]HQM49268.1 WD40 repeat domain-containing serine/threonine-protein kinase [Candidatus Hydrogenedentota bacterium]
MQRDRNFLFGIFAVQLGKVTQAQLMDVAGAWATDPSRSVADRLVQGGALSEQLRELIDRLVDEAIRAHEGDTAATLQTFGGTEQVNESFGGALLLTDTDGVTKPAPPLFPEPSPQTASLAAVFEAPGRYTHVSEYGRGGMGRVLLVHDESLGRDIALKELLPAGIGDADATAASPMRLSMQYLARFIQEARLTGQLQHPSIVPVYELGRRADGTLYYTMKLVRGSPLSRVIREAQSLGQRLGMISQFADLCQAIAYAHSRGVIHRDIKPANVLVGEFGETVVIDWGVAKVKDREDVHADGLAETIRMLNLGEDVDLAKTGYGHIVGTPVYMPPEQAAGDLEQVNERSDVYGLGAVLYSILTGRAPYEGGSTADILRKVRQEEPVPVPDLAPETPAELAAICKRAMARDPAKRYQSAKELADEVERFLSGALVQAYTYSFADHLRRFIGRHKAAVATAGIACIILLTIAGVYHFRLTVAHRREREQRMAAEAANERLLWENYAVSLTAAQKHMTDRQYETASQLLDKCPAQHRNWEWGLLKRACQPELWHLGDEDVPEDTYGMNGRVVFSPDGRYVLNKRFFSGLYHIYDLLEAKNVYVARESELPSARLGWIETCRFLPDGTAFTTTLDSHRVKLRRIADDASLAVFDAGSSEIRYLSFTPDGSRAAGLVVDQSPWHGIVLWDTASGKELRRFDLAPIQDPSYYAREDGGRWDRFLSRQAGQLLGFFRDGRRVVILDNQLGVLDVESGERTNVGACTAVAAFAPESGIAVMRNPSGNLEVWQMESITRLNTIQEDFGQIGDLALSPDGTLLAAAGPSLQLWDVAAGRKRYETPHSVRSLMFSPNSKAFLAISDGRYGCFDIWDATRIRDMETIPFTLETGESSSIEMKEVLGAQPVYAYNARGTRMASVAGGENLVLWQVPSFRREASWRIGGRKILCVAFSPDDERVATATPDEVAVWDIDTKEKLLAIPSEHEYYMKCCAFSASGARLAIGRASTKGVSDAGVNCAWVVDAASGERIYTVSGHPGACNMVQFSPDDRWLLTGTYGSPSVPGDISLRIWDAATGTELVGTIDRLNWPWHASFSPDNTKMLVVGLSIEPVLWDFEAQREVYRVKSGSARQVIFHPDGERFAVVRTPGVAIHAVKDGRELCSYPFGKLPGTFTLDGQSFICRYDAENMLILHASDWTVADRETEFRKGLAEVQELLQLRPASRSTP